MKLSHQNRSAFHFGTPAANPFTALHLRAVSARRIRTSANFVRNSFSICTSLVRPDLRILKHLAPPQSFSYCAQISWNSSTGGSSIEGQTLAVQPGDQINFGGWVNLQSGGGGALGWWIAAENSSGTAINWINAGSSPTTSGWQFQSGTYTVPSGVAYVLLYATVWQPSSSATILVDDGFLYDNRTSLQVAQNLDYLPFGELNSSDSGVNTHEFTGDELDSETNLDHTWFRQYSPTMARWLTPDPAGLAAVDPTNPQSWNRYAYALNNPLSLVHRSGLYCEYFDDAGILVDSIDAYSDAGECGDNGGTWVDENTTVVVNGGPDDSSGSGSGLPPGGCSFFYSDGTLDGTQCGNQFSPAEPPLSNLDFINAIHNGLQNLPAVCSVSASARFGPGKVSAGLQLNTDLASNTSLQASYRAQVFTLGPAQGSISGNGTNLPNAVVGVRIPDTPVSVGVTTPDGDTISGFQASARVNGLFNFSVGARVANAFQCPN